jgi:hypothetical protein
MDDVIITVTCDSSMSYPDFDYMSAIEDTDSVGQQYVDAVNAATGGASEIKVPEGTDAEICAVLALTEET